MKQAVWNLKLLSNLQPLKLLDYLENKGWNQQEQIADKAVVLTKNAGSEGTYELFVPLKSEAPDFVRRLTEVLETLEIVEQRPQSEILADLTDVHQAAVMYEREVLNFAIMFPSYYGYQAPILHLGNILRSLQDVVNGIGQSLALQNLPGHLSEIEKRKKIKPEFAKEMELTAFGTFKGSFGIRLMSSPSNLIQESLLPDSIQELVTLLNIGSETEGLRERLFKLRSSSARRYVAFLRALTQAEAGLNLDWGSPKENYGGAARITVNVARDALKVIEDLSTEQRFVHHLSGSLTQGDVKTKHFKFECDDGSDYTGYIADSAMPDSGVLPLGERCDVVIQETVLSYLVVAKEERLYKIVELNFSGNSRNQSRTLFS